MHTRTWRLSTHSVQRCTHSPLSPHPSSGSSLQPPHSPRIRHPTAHSRPLSPHPRRMQLLDFFIPPPAHTHHFDSLPFISLVVLPPCPRLAGSPLVVLFLFSFFFSFSFFCVSSSKCRICLTFPMLLGSLFCHTNVYLVSKPIRRRQPRPQASRPARRSNWAACFCCWC